MLHHLGLRDSAAPIGEGGRTRIIDFAWPGYNCNLCSPRTTSSRAPALGLLIRQSKLAAHTVLKGGGRADVDELGVLGCPRDLAYPLALSCASHPSWAAASLIALLPWHRRGPSGL